MTAEGTTCAKVRIGLVSDTHGVADQVRDLDTSH